MQGTINPGAEVFNKEIAELEAKLAAKKQELVNSGAETSEKEVFKQVVKEHGSGESLSPAVPSSAAPNATTSAGTAQVTPVVAAKVNTLVAHAFTQGIAAAVKEAKKTGDPYFIDLLHDRLADEYYQKLLQARKVNPS